MPKNDATKTPPRYSSRDFPAYRHRPGSTPHPIRDSAGHSYRKETPPAPIDDRSWQSADGYLFAIDLFNHGYYWEAHEELEAYWIGAGRDSMTGRLLQGIIQAAAALLKLECDRLESAERLAAAASEKLLEPEHELLGFDGAKLARDVTLAVEAARAGAETPGQARIELREVMPSS